MNGSNSDMYFAIKCSMQDSPEVVATVMFVSGIFIFGYCLRILERPLLGHSG